MDKAEKRAIEAYPDATFDGYFDEWYIKEQSQVAFNRARFIEGYKVAEKDLELTWEDMKTIIELDGNVGECDDFHGSQKYYEKVLEIFKEKRK